MVRFFLDDLEIFFPYDYVYPEQYAYMRQLKASIDVSGHAVLEMPTGTGKTVAVMSLYSSYQLSNPNKLQKFFFCTRTVGEMNKALAELRAVLRYRMNELMNDLIKADAINAPTERLIERIHAANIIGCPLSARRSLCTNPSVNGGGDRSVIDEKCRKLTVPWIRKAFYGGDPPGFVASALLPSNIATNNSNSAKTMHTSSENNQNISAPTIKDLNKYDIEDLFIKSCAGVKCSVCPWYENYMTNLLPNYLNEDIYTIDDLKAIGTFGLDPLPDEVSASLKSVIKLKNLSQEFIDKYFPSLPKWDNTDNNPIATTKFCPYYGSRDLARIASIVVLNYQYVLDPRVSQIPFGFIKSIGEDEQKQRWSIVFDEAHNIDNVCIEALSISINSVDIERARICLHKIKQQCEEKEALEVDVITENLASSVQPEIAEQYKELLSDFLASPLLPEEQAKLSKTMPGSIRKNKLFISNLLMVLIYLDSYIKKIQVKIEGPLTFLKNLEDALKLDMGSLKMYYDRLKNLYLYLQITNLNEYLPLTKIADFCTIITSYWKGFVLITDPYPDAPGIYDPIAQLSCIDSSLCMKPVLNRFSNVVLTSGTISPLYLYPRILGFVPAIMQSFQMSMDRDCICPIIVGKGGDQIPLSSRYELREDTAVMKEYGELILELAKNVPDGIVLFFTSYAYSEKVFTHWYKLGLIDAISKYKLIFMETKDIKTSTIALNAYRRACDCGRGAIFMSIARGKVAEGIDFDRNYGKAVVLIGVPYQYTLSHIIKSRLLFLKKQHQIDESEFLSFDAMRQASQCLGRVIRNKSDYGLMILADYRYAKSDKKNKLPDWVISSLTPERVGISTEAAMSIAKKFLLQMSQPNKINIRTRLNQDALSKLHIFNLRRKQKSDSVAVDTMIKTELAMQETI